MTKKVDMKPYNAALPPASRRQLTFYSTIGILPPAASHANLHASAHLYASDRNSLFIIPRFWEINDNFGAMSSLNHTVVFHGGAEMLDMARRQEEERWFAQESWTDRHGDGRGLHHSKIWDPSGRHIATTMQDGMVRLKFKDERDLVALRDRLGAKTSKI